MLNLEVAPEHSLNYERKSRMRLNTALKLPPFGRWTLRAKAQRLLCLR